MTRRAVRKRGEKNSAYSLALRRPRRSLQGRFFSSIGPNKLVRTIMLRSEINTAAKLGTSTTKQAVIGRTKWGLSAHSYFNSLSVFLRTANQRFLRLFSLNQRDNIADFPKLVCNASSHSRRDTQRLRAAPAVMETPRMHAGKRGVVMALLVTRGGAWTRSRPRRTGGALPSRSTCGPAPAPAPFPGRAHRDRAARWRRRPAGCGRAGSWRC